MWKNAHPAERLWKRHLSNIIGHIRDTRPLVARVRIFGTPARAQERVVLLTQALQAEAYDFRGVNPIAASLFFTVSDLYFERQSTASKPEHTPTST
jgi:hypothetical protein